MVGQSYRKECPIELDINLSSWIKTHFFFLLRQTVRRPKDANALPEYLQALVELLTESVYRVVSYALFARHKLTFSFMLCAGIMRHATMQSHDATIKEEEWNWFLRGSAVAAITDRLETEEDLDRGSLSPSSKAGGIVVLCSVNKTLSCVIVFSRFFLLI